MSSQPAKSGRGAPTAAELLEEKARKWRHHNNKKFGEKKKFGYTEVHK